MKKIVSMPVMACATLGIMHSAAFAQENAHKEEVSGSGRQVTKYDHSVEKAAQLRAAEKIGTLRGSLQGLKNGSILDKDMLKSRPSDMLGFPIIVPPQPVRQIEKDAEPIV